MAQPGANPQRHGPPGRRPGPPPDSPIQKYCRDHSVKLDPVYKELIEATNADDTVWGLASPEVHHFGQNLIRLVKGKRALDIGTLTGASAFSWALAVPEDGQVISMDVDHTNLNNIGLPILKKNPEILKKIDFRLAPALEILDSLIAAGESGKFDFAFIDANKEDYPQYYEKSVQLLRSGGVIQIDNSFAGGGRVLEPELSPMAKAIDATNKLAFNDDRVWNSLIQLGDGTHVIFKK